MPQPLPAPYITLSEEDAEELLELEDEFEHNLYEVADVTPISANVSGDLLRYILRRKADGTLWESVYFASVQDASEWQIFEPETYEVAFLQVPEVRPIPRYELHGLTF